MDAGKTEHQNDADLEGIGQRLGQALYDTTEVIGPWGMIPLFWMNLNLPSVLDWMTGPRTTHVLTIPSFVFFTLLILYAARRWSHRAVAPSLALIALNTVGVAPITNLPVSLSLARDDILSVPLMYLALRYGLDPTGTAERWLALRPNARDYLLIAGMLVFGFYLSSGAFTLSFDPGIYALLILILLVGIRPISMWALIFAFATIVAILLFSIQAPQYLSDALPNLRISASFFLAHVLFVPFLLFMCRYCLRRAPIEITGNATLGFAFSMGVLALFLTVEAQFSLASLGTFRTAAMWFGPLFLVLLSMNIRTVSALLLLLLGMVGAVIVSVLVPALIGNSEGFVSVIVWQDVVTLGFGGRNEVPSLIHQGYFFLWIAATLFLASTIAEGLRRDLSLGASSSATLGTVLLQNARQPVEPPKPGRLTLVFGKRLSVWLLWTLLAVHLAIAAALILRPAGGSVQNTSDFNPNATKTIGGTGGNTVGATDGSLIGGEPDGDLNSNTITDRGGAPLPNNIAPEPAKE